MTKFALYVPLQAKPGKEKEVADFLRSAVPLVNAEPGTIMVCHSRRTVFFRHLRYV
jgi:quinol monooxygenase YgiN